MKGARDAGKLEPHLRGQLVPQPELKTARHTAVLQMESIQESAGGLETDRAADLLPFPNHEPAPAPGSAGLGRSC